MNEDVLGRFSPATGAWFRGRFGAPTDAQAGAWRAVAGGRHTLVVAPTGSGKTLAAFLWALDGLAVGDGRETAGGREACRVVYVSPLKALAVDVERNLREPLVGIGAQAGRLGLAPPGVRIAVRTGDTPADERRAFARHPADILITTPESLFLMLTSSAREGLRGCRTVIVDEIHALAGTKRGAHLAVSLERLDELLPSPAQRIGLSATVNPVDEVARFLAGGRDVAVVAPEARKAWDLRVVVPVPDMSDLGMVPFEPEMTASPPGGARGGGSSSPASGGTQRATIWPHVEERIVDLIAEHRSTLVFANSRRLAERLTARINEIWWERTGGDPPELGGGGFERLFQPTRDAGEEESVPPMLARAHHGSVSREQRRQIEDDLKAGRLRAVVATSSLELGIDMGAIDLVIQVEAPPSVASGLQRVGRAGHQVGVVSRGVLFPKFAGDLVQTAVVVENMLAGAIERLRVPATPLDVLAQQVVAMVAMDSWAVPALLEVVRRSAPFATLTRPVLDSVLDMLSGRYPSDEFAELRPRLVWDRAADTLTGRRNAQRLAVVSGGTIPDRGLYGVFLAGDEGPGRRVGELDEEMVYESRVGDVFALGTSTWRIETITHDRVLVTPAPGVAARLPFWKGDALGRPAELGQAVGRFVREVGEAPAQQARERLAADGLDDWAADNLLSYLGAQREAIGRLPSDRQLVVERSRDELGDWRVAVLSPYGGRVHAPWALIAAARLRERFGVDVRAVHSDDGMVFRLPDADWDEQPSSETPVADGGFWRDPTNDQALLEAIFPDPEDVRALVTDQVGGSALFAARFRECAGRALLLPRRRPGQRQALWQQRLRASALLEVASAYPSFPIVLEAVRECMNDVFDVPALEELLRGVRSRQIDAVVVETARPSPFASSLMFGYVAQFLYEGDAPLAERRAAALNLDPALLADLLGTSEGLALADLLDSEQLTRTESELQCLDERRRARDADELGDLLRTLGPLGAAQVGRRSASPERTAAWLEELEADGRAFPVGFGRWAAAEDAGRLFDIVGVRAPPGVPDVFRERVDDPLGDMLARYARAHVPFTAGEAADWLRVGVAVARDGLRRLVADGRLLEGELRPPGWVAPEAVGASLPAIWPTGVTPSGGCFPLDAADAPPEATQYCDPRVLALLRRRSAAALRHAVEPVTPVDLARFLPGWHELGRRRGVDGVLRTVEQVAGVPLPASAWESLILPSRVADYKPAMLDELVAAGEVVWQGHGALAAADGWISLHPADLAPLTLAGGATVGVGGDPHAPASRARPGSIVTDAAPPSDGAIPACSPLADRVLAALATGGAMFLRALSDALRAATDPDAAAPTDRDLADALWQLVWAGQVTNDTFAPVRALLSGGTTTHRAKPSATPRGRYARLRRPLVGVLPPPPQAAGRWSLLPARDADATRRAVVWSELLLDRYGVVTRGSVAAEDLPGGFAGVYRVLAAAEDAGRVRRGYFVEGLGAAQFAETGVIDRLRAQAEPRKKGAVVLAAADPANPYGAALAWPSRPSGVAHLPGRKAGALVVVADGRLVCYLERGAKTILTWTDDPAALRPAAESLAQAVRTGALAGLTIEKVDGESVFASAHPLLSALDEAGFHLTPRGLRFRPTTA